MMAEVVATGEHTYDKLKPHDAAPGDRVRVFDDGQIEVFWQAPQPKHS
jgi:hypothetical protein